MGGFYLLVGVTDTLDDHSGFKLRRKPLVTGNARVRSKVVWPTPERAAKVGHPLAGKVGPT